MDTWYMVCDNHNEFCAVNYCCRKHETIEIQFCIMNNFGVVVGCQMRSNKNSGPEAKPVEHHCTTRFKISIVTDALMYITI